MIKTFPRRLSIGARSTLTLTLIVTLAIYVALFTTPTLAANHAVEVNFAQEIVNNVHYFYTLNVKDSRDLTGGFHLESSLGLGNLLDWSEPVVSLETGAYKKIPGASEYSLGVSYRYVYNRRSFYGEVGGKLTQRLLYLKLRGETHFDLTRIYAELAYAPIGSFNYMGEHVRSMTAFNLTLGAVTPLTDALNLAIEGKYGNETYVATTNLLGTYRLGLQYRFR